VPVSSRRWTAAAAADLLRLTVLDMLVNFSLSCGSCRAYIKSSASYLERHGAPPDMHHLAKNPGLKGIWKDANKTSAGLVKRAAIIGRRFLQEGFKIAKAKSFPAAGQHFTGLILSFFFFLRISEFSGDGNAAEAGPLRAFDVSFYTKSRSKGPHVKSLLPRHHGALASTIAVRIKGSKTDSGAQGAVRCAEQPEPTTGIDLAGTIAGAVAAAERRGGATAILLPQVSYATYDAFIKLIASNLGRNPSTHTSHIGRRSAATRLAAAGLKDKVAHAGRWDSDAWQTYIEECLHICEGNADAMLQEFSFVFPD